MQLTALCVPIGRGLTKTLRVMQLTAFILLACCLQISAKVASQSINFSAKNASLESTFKAIRKQTDYSVFWNKRILRDAQPITLTVKEVPLLEFLDRILKGQSLTYSIEGNAILIKREPKPAAASETAKFISPPIDIRGRILDEYGAPVSGASVQIKGDLTKGTSTDSQGYFMLNDIQDNATLIISGVNIESAEIKVANRKEFSVTVRTVVSSLNETVVIGYGVQNKRNVASSIAKVNENEFKKATVSTVDQALQGRAAGVQVQQTSGEPGADVELRIRGNNSLSGNNEPLYVIDGFILPQYTEAPNTLYGSFRQNGLYGLNPNDIASVEVLKDASATSIYGSRGANGVILITTKSGRKGVGRVELVNKTFVGSIAKRIKMMNGKEYATIRNEYADLTGNSKPYDVDTITQSTDWLDAITKNAFREEVGLNVSGGTDKTIYYVSGSFLKDKGILLNSDITRGNIRANLNSDVTSWYSLRLQGAITRQTSNRALSTSKGFPQVAGAVLDALRASPLLPKDYIGLSPATGGFSAIFFQNPYIDLSQKTDIQYNDNIVFNLENIFRITDNLNFVASVGTNQEVNRRQIFFNANLNNGFLQNGEGTSAVSNTYSYNASGYFSFDKQIGKDHKINAVLGAESNTSTLELVSTYGANFGVQTLGAFSLGVAQTQTIGTYKEKRVIESGFARATYAYKGKYVLNASMRVDGASPFAENKKIGYFPAVGVAWNLKEEKFMEGVTFFRDLKIRGSYGITGSQAISPYSSLSRWSTAFYEIGNPYVISSLLRPDALGNANLTWEETEQYNIGADFSILKNILTVSFDYYHKLTKGLLQQKSIPSQSGFTSITDNSGTMLNSGIELNLQAKIINRRDLKVSTSAILSRNKNVLQDLGPNTAAQYFAISGNLQGGVSHILKPGERVGDIFGYQLDGLIQPKDLDGGGNPTFPFPGGAINQTPGSWKYVDVNGDGTINGDDRKVLGHGTPDFTYGWTTDFTWKRFGLNVFFNGSYGNDIVNVTGFYLNSGVMNQFAGITFSQTQDWYSNRWTTANQHNNVKYPSVQAGIGEAVSDVTSAMVENGSFFRLKSLTLSYSFRDYGPLKTPQVFVTGTNLFTITKYTGFDPEVSSFQQSVVQPGVDFGAYPTTRTLTLGVTCSF